MSYSKSVRNPRKKLGRNKRDEAIDLTLRGIELSHETPAMRAAQRVHGMTSETKSASPVTPRPQIRSPPLTPLQKAASALHDHKQKKPFKDIDPSSMDDQTIRGRGGERSTVEEAQDAWEEKRDQLLANVKSLHAQAQAQGSDPHATTSGGVFGYFTTDSVDMPKNDDQYTGPSKIKLKKGGKKHKRKTKKHRRKHKKRARTHKKKHSRKTRSKKHHKKRRRSTKKRR